MWVLSHKTNPAKVYYILQGKKEHTVGRKDCDLHLPGDLSVSRTHAFLLAEDNQIRLIDNDSKYGTYVNENIESKISIPQKIPFKVLGDSRIRFGVLENEFAVKKQPIVTVTSTIDETTRTDVQAKLKAVQGLVVTEWREDCTHLTMKEIVITNKVLLALVKQIPIVTPNYWKAFLKSVASKEPLPDTKEYLPALVDKFLGGNVVLHPNKARQNIFDKLIFVFMQSKQMTKYKPVIELAGGKCLSLDTTQISKSSLTKSNAVVIQNTPNESCSQQRSSATTSVIEYLQKHGKRIIPEREIGMAIITCSTSKNCNPEFKPKFMELAESLVPSTEESILVRGTPCQISGASSFASSTEKEIIIPETVTSQATSDAIEPPNMRIAESENDSDGDLLQGDASKKTVPMSLEFEEMDILVRDAFGVDKEKEQPTSTKRKQMDSPVKLSQAKRSCGTSLPEKPMTNTSMRKTRISVNQNEKIPALATRISARNKANANVEEKAANSPQSRSSDCSKVAKITPQKKSPIVTKLPSDSEENSKSPQFTTKRAYPKSPDESASVDSDHEQPTKLQKLNVRPSQITNTTKNSKQTHALDILTKEKSPEPFQSRDLNRTESAVRRRNDFNPNNLFNFVGEEEGPSKRRRALREKRAAEAAAAKVATSVVSSKSASSVNDISFLSRVKISNDRWISRSLQNHTKLIKDETDKSADVDVSWVDSILDGFEVKTLKINVSAKSFVSDCVNNVSNGNQGFKAFKKKQIYNAPAFNCKLVPTSIH